MSAGAEFHCSSFWRGERARNSHSILKKSTLPHHTSGGGCFLRLGYCQKCRERLREITSNRHFLLLGSAGLASFVESTGLAFTGLTVLRVLNSFRFEFTRHL